MDTKFSESMRVAIRAAFSLITGNLLVIRPGSSEKIKLDIPRWCPGDFFTKIRGLPIQHIGCYPSENSGIGWRELKREVHFFFGKDHVVTVTLDGVVYDQGFVPLTVGARTCWNAIKIAYVQNIPINNDYKWAEFDLVPTA